jgi:hypothetical protein
MGFIRTYINQLRMPGELSLRSKLRTAFYDRMTKSTGCEAVHSDATHTHFKTRAQREMRGSCSYGLGVWAVFEIGR